MSDTESLNYFKLIKLILDIGTKVSRETINNFCVNKNVTVEQMLNEDKSKHVLFHLWQNTSCCLCDKGRRRQFWNKNDNKVVNTKQWNMLYAVSHPEVEGHVIRGSDGKTCLCKYSAVKGTKTENLEISLATCLILNLCKPLDQALKTDISNLRMWKNDIVSHSGNRARISCEDFKSHWREITGTISCISQRCGPAIEEAVKKEISDIENLNFVDTKSNLKMMQNCKEEYTTYETIIEEFEKMRLAVTENFEDVSSRLEGLTTKVELLNKDVADEIKTLLSNMNTAANHDREAIRKQLEIWQQAIKQELQAAVEMSVMEHTCSTDRGGESEKFSANESNIIECTKTEIDEHRKRVFCPTRALKEAITRLKAFRIVVLTGNDGSGKTATALELLKTLQDENKTSGENLIVMHISSTEGLEKLINPNRNIVLFLDYSDFTNSQGDVKGRLEMLWSLISNGRIQLVMTLPSTVFESNSKFLQNCDILNERYVIDLSGGRFQLTFEEKEQLFKLHVDKRNNAIAIVRYQEKENLYSDEILDTSVKVKIFRKTVEEIAESDPIIGYPLCCTKFFADRLNMKLGARFFNQCSSFLLTEISNLLESGDEGNKRQFALLVLMMLNGGHLVFRSIEDLRKISFTSKIQNELGIILSLAVDVRIALKNLSKKAIIKSNAGFNQFSHVAYYDAVLITYAELLPENMDDLVLRSSSRILSQVLKTSNYKKSPNEMVLLVPRCCYKSLIDRFVMELNKTNYRAVLCHQSMADDEFVSKFIIEIISVPKHDIFRNKDEHGYTFAEYDQFDQFSGLALFDKLKQNNVL